MALPESAEPLAVFIGAPGAGKTRLGKRVAKRLGVPFVDTDKTIVAEHGPIPAIFEAHGEPYFREIERQHVSSALASRSIVALGGGAVLHPDTQRDLANLRVIQVTVSPEAVAARIDNAKRPLLAQGVEAWVALVAARQPIYDALATRSWDTSRLPIDGIAADISQWIESETA